MERKRKQEARKRRHRRVRGKISGTNKRPRLCVFRSGKHIYAQLIDDENNKILAVASDLKLKRKKGKKSSSKKEVSSKSDGRPLKDKKELLGKIALGFEVGKLIAEKAIDLKIEEIVFDRGGFKYHGRVKSLADGARSGGLKF